MTAAGTFALDTATYLTAESDTLASVTGRGASTTTAVTMAKLTLTGAVSGVGNLSSYTVTAASGSAISKQITSTLIASANGDTLVGLDIAPTFTTGAFTGVTRVPFRAYLDTTTNNYIRYHNNAVPGYHSFEIRNDTTSAGYASIQSQVQTRINYMQIYCSGDSASLFGVTRGGWAGNISENVSGMFFGTTTAADVIMGANNTATMRIFNATRNVVIQNGGTFTDAGFRLDVNGTARIQNQLTTTGSITAASAIARGVYMNQTLVAAANGDTLVGLDIAPTFTLGAFTGVNNFSLRVTGAIRNTIGSANLYTSNVVGGATLSLHSDTPISSNYFIRADTTSVILNSPQSNGFILFRQGNGSIGQFFGTTGNFTLQNGGTFTDNGFRLEVVGTARITNVLTLGSLASDPTGSNGMIYYNTTTNRFKVYQNGAWATITAI